MCITFNLQGIFQKIPINWLNCCSRWGCRPTPPPAGLPLNAQLGNVEGPAPQPRKTTAASIRQLQWSSILCLLWVQGQRHNASCRGFRLTTSGVVLLLWNDCPLRRSVLGDFLQLHLHAFWVENTSPHQPPKTPGVGRRLSQADKNVQKAQISKSRVTANQLLKTPRQKLEVGQISLRLQVLSFSQKLRVFSPSFGKQGIYFY